MPASQQKNEDDSSVSGLTGRVQMMTREIEATSLSLREIVDSMQVGRDSVYSRLTTIEVEMKQMIAGIAELRGFATASATLIPDVAALKTKVAEMAVELNTTKETVKVQQEAMKAQQDSSGDTKKIIWFVISLVLAATASAIGTRLLSAH